MIKINPSEVETIVKIAKRSAEDVFDECKKNLTIYRHHRKGWTNDKEKSMKHITSIPEWVYFDPEHKKYFDPRMSKEERRKSIDRWILKNDWFRYDA